MTDVKRLKAALAELEREKSLRQRVYPAWVREGRLTEKQARERIALLEYVIEFVREQLKTLDGSE
jgi:hypothetical protein